MDVRLRHLHHFSNWTHALAFLSTDLSHYLLCDQMPPAELPHELKHRVLILGIPSCDGFICLPPNWGEDDARVFAAGLSRVSATHHQRSKNHFIGSIPGAQFLDFLHGFSQVLRGKFDVEEIAQAITRETSRLFSAEGASILLPSDDGTRFRFAYILSPDQSIVDRLSKTEASIERGITGWVARHRKAILVRDVSKHPAFDPSIDEQTRFQTSNMLAAPVMIGNELIAILEIVNKLEGGFEDSDLQVAELIASIIAIFIEKAQLYHHKMAYARMNRELEIAHSLQQHMMPNLPARIGPFRVSGDTRQVSRVGGDFWDVLEFKPNEYLLMLGDVSGHGLSAALMMSAIRTASRAILRQLRAPEALLDTLNLLIYEEFGAKNLYATLILLHLDTQTHRIRFTRCGHEYPILRRDKDWRALNNRGGLPVGIFPGTYQSPWEELLFKCGDQLFFYTDGVLDGLGDQQANLIDELRHLKDLDELLETKSFFEALIQQRNWREIDDATMLKLEFSECEEEAF